MQDLKIYGDASHGFRVVYLTSVDSDSPIETFYHFALFADRADAEGLVTKMRRSGLPRLNLSSYWSWRVDTNRVTGLSVCSEPPAVVLETTPRPSARRGA